jgi:uncharacterized protein (DUF433 family)
MKRYFDCIIGGHMDWKLYIESDQKRLGGKPVVKGTRLAVDFILGLFAAGWTRENLLENYPILDENAIRAVFAFAAEAMHEETFLPLMRKVA